MPLISVIIPCYNAAAYLMRCANSLLNQTIGIANLELIFVDDASSDNTWELLQTLTKKYPSNVIALKCPTNMRQGGARNLGLAHASGDYIGFVDSDDWVEETMYERMYQKITTGDADLVYCKHIRDYGTQNLSQLLQQKKEQSQDQIYVIDTDDKRSDFIASGCIGYNVWDKLFKRSFLTNHPFTFPEHLIYEDIYFGSLVYLYATKVYVLDEILYHYFVNDTSTVLNNNDPKHYDLFRIHQLKWNFMNEQGFLDRYEAALTFDYLVTFYLTGCKMFSLRYETFPYDAYQKMRQDIILKFPAYAKTPYIKSHLNEFYQLLISFLAVNVDEKNLLAIQAQINQYFHANE